MEKPPYYQSIAETLLSVKRLEVYAIGEEAGMPLPVISLTESNTILQLPICETQAKHLVELASRALIRRREQTVLHELNPTQFSITNSQWEESLQELLAKVKTGLGCDAKTKITCELCKLLLYESGGFFKVRTHQHCVVIYSHT